MHGRAARRPPARTTPRSASTVRGRAHRREQRVERVAVVGHRHLDDVEPDDAAEELGEPCGVVARRAEHLDERVPRRQRRVDRRDARGVRRRAQRAQAARQEGRRRADERARAARPRRSPRAPFASRRPTRRPTPARSPRRAPRPRACPRSRRAARARRRGREAARDELGPRVVEQALELGLGALGAHVRRHLEAAQRRRAPPSRSRSRPCRRSRSASRRAARCVARRWHGGGRRAAATVGGAAVGAVAVGGAAGAIVGVADAIIGGARRCWPRRARGSVWRSTRTRGARSARSAVPSLVVASAITCTTSVRGKIEPVLVHAISAEWRSIPSRSLAPCLPVTCMRQRTLSSSSFILRAGRERRHARAGAKRQFGGRSWFPNQNGARHAARTAPMTLRLLHSLALGALAGRPQRLDRSRARDRRQRARRPRQRRARREQRVRARRSSRRARSTSSARRCSSGSAPRSRRGRARRSRRPRSPRPPRAGGSSRTARRAGRCRARTTPRPPRSACASRCSSTTSGRPSRSSGACCARTPARRRVGGDVVPRRARARACSAAPTPRPPPPRTRRRTPSPCTARAPADRRARGRPRRRRGRAARRVAERRDGRARRRVRDGSTARGGRALVLGDEPAYVAALGGAHRARAAAASSAANASAVEDSRDAGTRLDAPLEPTCAGAAAGRRSSRSSSSARPRRARAHVPSTFAMLAPRGAGASTSCTYGRPARASVARPRSTRARATVGRVDVVPVRGVRTPARGFSMRLRAEACGAPRGRAAPGWKVRGAHGHPHMSATGGPTAGRFAGRRKGRRVGSG